MRALIAMGLLCASLSWADTPADRTAIAKVVGSLSTANPVSVLFTADADSQLDQLTQPATGRPRIAIQSIRFLTPQIALVDAESTQVGSAAVWRMAVWMVMKKEGSDWKIASLRLPEVSDFV